MTHRTSGPTPFEVFAWYHQLVPGKVYRALVSAGHAFACFGETAFARVTDSLG
jgi:hypothetical protein